MINENLLRAAAAVSCDRFADALARDFETAETHAFSPAFDQKLRKLGRRAEHPFLYRPARRVAVVFLAILIGVGVWLASDVSARAAVSGWIKEMYEMFFVYRYAQAETRPAEAGDVMRHYRLTWLPEGYTAYKSVELNGNVTVQYVEESGKRLRFSYTSGEHATDWFVDTTDTVRSTVLVGGKEADLFLAQSEDDSSILLWTAENGDAFYVCGFLSAEELIRLAESVEKTE